MGMDCDPDILAQLAPMRLLTAYAAGVFPMVTDGELYWYRPDPRGLLPLDGSFHVSRSLRRRLRRGDYECTVDRAFEAVIDACADRPDGTWISPEIRQAYLQLHRSGCCHSIEAWPAGQIGCGEPAGGVYGVHLGGAFFAESMFHRATDAGKLALVQLVGRLVARGFQVLDVQWTTAHLATFGAFDLPADAYDELLQQALAADCPFR